MELTENQKKAIAAIKWSLISFVEMYKKLKDEDDCVDTEAIIENEFKTYFNDENAPSEVDIIKDELFDLLTTVEELNYDEN